MKKILYLILILCCTSGFSQSSQQDNIYVCFKHQGGQNSAAFTAFTKVNNAVVTPAVIMPQEKLDALVRSAERLIGNSASVQKLQRIFTVSFTGAGVNALEGAIAELNKMDEVEYAERAITAAIKPPGDILPVTPNYLQMQGYAQQDPGVNMQYCWNLGYTGQGIRVRDVEYGLNVNHEELNEANTFVAPGMTVSNDASVAYTEHGTAAIGVVYSDDGAYGLTGLAYGADEVVLFPEWTAENGYNRINAVTQAVANSQEGDVIMYEMQVPAFSENDFLPAEYTQVVWDLTKAATDAGIVVVAAAGNGNQSLDSFLFNQYIQRGDSGAIIVGAGSYDASHDRLYFSTYGSRVNVQAWGQNVIAPGYGDLFAIGNDFNQYYTLFSGTSSATPIVTSCAVVLQSYYHDQTGGYLTSQQIREILVASGIPQGIASQNKPIGPIPDMEAAMNLVAASIMQSNSFTDKRKPIRLFPNPAKDFFTVANDNTADHFSVTMYNTLGQKVYSADNQESGKQIDISGMDSGIYVVEIRSGSDIQYSRIIKK